MVIAFLISVAVSLLSAAFIWMLTKKVLPSLNALGAGMRRLSIGDTVSWRNFGNFLVLDRKGTAFRYEYKLVNIAKISPWLLPVVSYNPHLMSEATVFWYKGSKGACYLKKTGHPRLELKMPICSAGINPSP